jgi:hypothetical protein
VLGRNLIYSIFLNSPKGLRRGRKKGIKREIDLSLS